MFVVFLLHTTLLINEYLPLISYQTENERRVRHTHLPWEAGVDVIAFKFRDKSTISMQMCVRLGNCLFLKTGQFGFCAKPAEFRKN